MNSFSEMLAREFSIRPEQVQAVIDLLDAGNTIPFIARYRKEATGSLDDQVLRELSERMNSEISSGKPRRFQNWKTCTGHSAPSAVHGQPLPGSTGWNRWRYGCSFSFPRPISWRKPKNM